MKKILFFYVADYENEFFMKACEGKFDYELVSESLNNLVEISASWQDDLRPWRKPEYQCKGCK